MNDEYLKKLYSYLGSQDSEYHKRTTYDDFKSKMGSEDYSTKVHGYIKGIDSEFRSLEDFNSMLKKKSDWGSTLGSGSSASQKTERKATKEIAKTKDLRNVADKGSEIFTGYPGKEKNQYEFSNGNWYELNPEVEKTIKKSKESYVPVGGLPMGGGMFVNPSGEGQDFATPGTSKNSLDAIKNVPKKRIIEDDARVKALNKQFGKNASLDADYETFGDYDNSPEKKDNKYRIKNNSWERLVPGATEWSSIANEGSINALNNRYGKNIDAKKAIVVKPNEIDPFLKVNSNFLAQSEESAQQMLEKNFKGMGFTFEQIGAGDYIKVTPNNGNEPQTFAFNNVGNSTRGAFSSPTGMGIGNNNSKELEKNVDQSVKLQAYLRFNASTEKEDDLSSVNRIKNNTSRGKAAYVDPNNFIENNKYYESEDYKNAFKELTFQQKKNEIREREREAVNLSIADGDGWLMESINEYVFGDTPNAKARKERLLKAKQTLYKSEEYKLYDDEQKKYDAQKGEKYDKLYDEYVIVKQSGDKEAIKTVKTKIEGAYSKDLIGDNLNHMTGTQYDLQRDINDFNKRKEKLQLDAKNGNLTQEQYNDAVEGLSSEAQRLDVAAKNVAASQKRMNALAGVYVAEKAKSGGFFGNFTNALVVGMDEVREPLSYIFPLIGKDLSGDEAREISLDSKIITPQQRQYYKDKGFSDEQIKNVLINNVQKNAIDANKRAIIETFGSDLTTEESKQNLGFVGQALVGVAASLPSMLTRAIPIVGVPLAFTSMANMSYNAINEEMLNDTDFETTSEADRALVAVPYAVVMGYLENVGLKNMTAGKSAVLGKYVLGQLAKVVPKKLGREAIENIVNKEVKSLVGKGVLKVVSGGFAEAETGAIQTLVADIGIKKVYNSIRAAYTGEDLKELTGGEAFGTPQSFSEGLMAVGEGALAEAIGGFAMSTVMVGAQGLINGKISLYNKDDLKFFEDFSSDQEFKKLIVSNLKTQMLNGTMTKGEAQSALNDIDLVEGVFNSIDENISEMAKLTAFNLINERNRLEKEVVGKDPALSKEKNDRIKDINDKLGTLPLQILVVNNIERATELETALKQKGAVIINGKKIPRVEAQTELNKINQKVSDAERKQEEDAIKASIPEEISSLEDDEVKVLAVKTLEEIPEQFRDRAQLSPLTEVETREKIFGLPIGKKGSKLIGGGYTYTLTGKEAKDYAIQEQTAGEVPVQPTTTVGEEVVQGEPTAEPQVLTEEGKAEEVVPLTLEEELQIIADEKVIAPTLEAPVIEAPVVETPTLEAPTLETPVVEATPKEKVVAYRAEEQAELLKAIPKIESYKVKGKIDKTKMPKTVLAKYNKIYDKYDALISPLLPAVKTKAPVVKAPAVKAEAPKAEGKPTVMSWSKVEEYDDAVIRSMKEIQYGKLKPLLALKNRTTVAQKEEIKTIQAKIATAEKILDKRANKIKKEAQRVEKEGKGATVRAVDNNGTEAEYSVVVSKDGATAKVQLKKIGTLTPKRATPEANLKVQTDEKRGRFVETKNKTKVYIDEKVTPPKAEVKSAPKTTSVKTLFESNPELANEVYEALGIKDNVVTKTKKKIDFDKLDKKWSDKILAILKEKYPEVNFEFTEDTIQFIDDPMVFMQLSNKMYAEFKRLLTKNRPDLVARGLIEKSLDDISAFSDEFGTKENKTKLEKLAFHWMLNGAVILPEDGPKVVEAEKIASKKKLDAFSYSNPNEIIEKFAEESKKEKVDPDTLSSFTNKKDIGDGIVIYDVENSDKGQEQARIVLDTHFGEKSNPWCLLYKDADGSLTRAKEHWFNTYPGPKKIAFQNGKLIAFYGGSLWWDRLDNSSDGIPIVKKIKDDSLKRKQLIVVDSNDANKIISYGNKTLGNEQNGEYKEWDKNDNLRTEANFKDGKPDGKRIEYYSNGQLQFETNYKDGKLHGKYIEYYSNGQLGIETNYKDGKPDGKRIEYYSNGDIKSEKNFKDGKLHGKHIEYYSNGQIEIETNYKDDKPDGKRIEYYSNGDIKSETNFKDGKLHGKYIRYYTKGRILSETNYKDDKPDGKRIEYYSNGQLQFETNYKDGKFDGKRIEYYSNGQIEIETNYKDGKLDGKRIEYYSNGDIKSEKNFKDGKLHGKHIEYYSNGQLGIETNYKDGKFDGKHIEYYSNGQIEIETNYKDGKLVSEVNFQRNKENEIIGQANTKALTILVNALKQKKDTIPHEYAHIYIAMFRDTPIVQEGIKRFGSEEKLVQAIGEQVVQQKGEAYNWWKKFTNFIFNIMSDQQVVQVLTDSFLERADLTTYNYTQYSKAQAQDLYSDYIKQNPSSDIDGFREFVFEKQAPAPAKESTDDLMGAIDSIKEDIKATTEEIEAVRAEAKGKIKKINAENIDLDDLEADIKEIQDDLKKDLDGLKLDLDRHVKALKEEVKKLEDLDTKNPENKKTLLSYLDAAIKTLNGLDKLTYAKLDAGVTLGTLKLILQGIRAGVVAGNTISASIKAMASQYRGKHKNKKITIAEFTKEIEEYLRNTFVDQKTNEQDIQEARDKFVEIREAVRKAKLAVKTESKALRASAEKAIREMLKGKVKDLSAVQMKSIILRLARFNVFSQSQYDKFIDYVDKVIGIADYDAKVAKANENRKTAKKNLPKLGDISSDLLEPLSRVLNINAKLIPRDVFESYYEIVDMLSKRDAILELNKRADLNESIDKIIESIELNEQRVSDLKELYDNFADKVVENKVINYSKTLDKMLEDGVIDKTEHELMKTFKSKIQGAKVKAKMTEQEIADEKAELIDEINNTTITLDEIVGDEFRLERDLVKRLQILLKNKESLESLNNKDLKDLLRIIDNINNGFVSNATQQMVEKLNFIEKSISLESAIPKTVAGIFKKIRQYITDLTSRDKFGVNIALLFNIDEQFGDFKTKTIFNSVFEQSAVAQQIYQSEITGIQGELTQVEKAISNIFKNNGNKVILSKFKMMVYMMQLEYNSNPNNKQVHQAMKTLDETIKFAKQNSKKSGYKAADIKQMEFIKDNFQKDGEIDIDKLYNSFNEAEKNALKKLQEINNRMTKKATYTASVINGKKIKPIKNYVFYNTISASDRLSTAELINNMSNNMNPTTTSKNLEERDGKVHPVNLNAFFAVNQSARSVLINYHMTEPIRTARKTLSKAMKLLEDNNATTDQYEILTTIGDAYDTATRDLLQSNFTQSNEVMNWLQKTGYRAMLASAPRAISELMSNVSFVMINNPRDMAVGMNEYWTLSTSEDAKDILTILGSKVTSRNYPSDKLSSGLVDLSAVTSKLSKNRNIQSREVNGVFQLYDNTLGKWVNGVEFVADNLISQPDKIVMKPLWFGAFARSFQKETGVAPDFDKIKANNEEYMDKYRDALTKAKNNADTQTISAGSSTNAYMGILQNVVREGDSSTKQIAKNFNKFMNKFTVQEYYTARKGVNALVGNGDIPWEQGAQILAAVTARMTLYVTATRLLSELMLSAFGYGNDDDDEDKKTMLQRLYQGVVSSATTLLIGRSFGNIIRVIENSLIEKANEEYGEKIGLRNGEYDPYEDAVQFNQLQKGKIDEPTDLVKIIAGPYAPLIGVGELGFKLLEPEPKTERAKLTRAKEWYRAGMETLGLLGAVPFYRDIKKVALAEVYKELKKETKETAIKKESQDKADAEEIVQKTSILKQMMNSGAYTREGIKKELRKIKDPEYRKAENKIEEDMLKSILDKTKYSSRTDFEEREKENAKNAFKLYDKKREESLKINRELKNRMDALEYGEQYVPKKEKTNDFEDGFGGGDGFGGNDGFGGGDGFGGNDGFGGG